MAVLRILTRALRAAGGAQGLLALRPNCHWHAALAMRRLASVAPTAGANESPRLSPQAQDVCRLIRKNRSQQRAGDRCVQCVENSKIVGDIWVVVHGNAFVFDPGMSVQLTGRAFTHTDLQSTRHATRAQYP